MRTIGNFEKALGRRGAVGAAVTPGSDGKPHGAFRPPPAHLPARAARGQRLLQSGNASALLFGYFRLPRRARRQSAGRPGLHLPLARHRRARDDPRAAGRAAPPVSSEPTNPDVLAFHEAFADIVALFQHFTMPEVLRAAIRRSKGHAGLSNELAGLAVQFGQAIGQHGALRGSAIEGPADAERLSIRRTRPTRGARSWSPRSSRPSGGYTIARPRICSASPPAEPVSCPRATFPTT